MVFGIPIILWICTNYLTHVWLDCQDIILSDAEMQVKRLWFIPLSFILFAPVYLNIMDYLSVSLNCIRDRDRIKNHHVRTRIGQVQWSICIYILTFGQCENLIRTYPVYLFGPYVWPKVLIVGGFIIMQIRLRRLIHCTCQDCLTWFEYTLSPIPLPWYHHNRLRHVVCTWFDLIVASNDLWSIIYRRVCTYIMYKYTHYSFIYFEF